MPWLLQPSVPKQLLSYCRPAETQATAHRLQRSRINKQGIDKKKISAKHSAALQLLVQMQPGRQTRLYKRVNGMKGFLKLLP